MLYFLIAIDIEILCFMNEVIAEWSEKLNLLYLILSLIQWNFFSDNSVNSQRIYLPEIIAVFPGFRESEQFFQSVLNLKEDVLSGRTSCALKSDQVAFCWWKQ